MEVLRLSSPIARQIGAASAVAPQQSAQSGLCGAIGSASAIARQVVAVSTIELDSA